MLITALAIAIVTVVATILLRKGEGTPQPAHEGDAPADAADAADAAEAPELVG
jgi:hypothetical protein